MLPFKDGEHIAKSGSLTLIFKLFCFQVSCFQLYYARQLDPRTEHSIFILLRSLTSPRIRQVHLQDATIQKKILKPKEVSLYSPHKEESSNIENELFDVDDDVGT